VEAFGIVDILQKRLETSLSLLKGLILVKIDFPLLMLAYRIQGCHLSTFMVCLYGGHFSAVLTPIGRANKGALKDARADDLAAFALAAALERVPQLDRSLIEDLILGCAFTEGEQGMNLAPWWAPLQATHLT
jgi:Thiolase, N-terminal domain